MKRINLNKITQSVTIEGMASNDGYYLNPTERYIINLEDEMEFQASIMMAFQIIGPPPAIKNYHAWLFENGFSVDVPNPTNEIVSGYFGVKPLWKTDYSQGIVVKNESDLNYYIVMECSGKNRGYKHTIIVLTLGGCL